MMSDQENPQTAHGHGNGAAQHGQPAQQAGEQGQEAARRVIRAGEQGEEAARRVLRAGEQAGEQGEETARRVIRAGEQAAAQGEETARRVLRAGEQAAGRTAQAGARMGETAANTLRSMTASTFDTMTRMARGNGAAQTGRAVAVDLRAVSRSLEGVMESGMILANSAQTAMNQWMGYNRHLIDRNSKAFGDLMRCRHPEEVIAWQADYLKASIQDWLNTSMQLCELSANAAKEAADKIKETGIHAAHEARAAE